MDLDKLAMDFAALKRRVQPMLEAYEAQNGGAPATPTAPPTTPPASDEPASKTDDDED